MSLTLSEIIFLVCLVSLCLGYALWANRRFDKGLGKQIELPDETHFVHMPCASPCVLCDSASSTTLPHRAK